jgi:hypothetical protein
MSRKVSFRVTTADKPRHCEERGDKAISLSYSSMQGVKYLKEIASFLAMTLVGVDSITAPFASHNHSSSTGQWGYLLRKLL